MLDSAFDSAFPRAFFPQGLLRFAYFDMLTRTRFASVVVIEEERRRRTGLKAVCIMLIQTIDRAGRLLVEMKRKWILSLLMTRNFCVETSA
jgi:hypothetical protein